MSVDQNALAATLAKLAKERVRPVTAKRTALIERLEADRDELARRVRAARGV